MKCLPLLAPGIVWVCICTPLLAQSNVKKEPAPSKALAPKTAAPKTTAPKAADPAVAPAQPAENPELTAIRKSATAFEAAFNSGNGADVAALWTEDGEYIDEAGQLFTGRKAIEAEYQKIFANKTPPQIRIVIDSLRLLSDSAALEDGHAILNPTAAGAGSISKYTAVHVKVAGQWLMSSVRETPIETPPGTGHVEDLEWLIGTWVAEEYGSRTESVCRWLGKKSFVERTYTVTHPDQSTTSGVQIIGWNPQAGQLQSWNFSSDGGIAIGNWSPREQGWSAELHGTLADGTSTTAVNLLTRLDDNAYAWQSIQRTVGGNSIPDTDEVVLKRQKK